MKGNQVSTQKPAEGLRQFRKKPITVEAYQLTREIIEGILFDSRTLPVGLHFRSAGYHAENRTISHARFYVTTIHGQETDVVEGDWIITEPDGVHFYPCKPEIFAATYEPAAPTPAVAPPIEARGWLLTEAQQFFAVGEFRVVPVNEFRVVPDKLVFVAEDGTTLWFPVERLPKLLDAYYAACRAKEK